jgi:hypothetical protein
MTYSLSYQRRAHLVTIMVIAVMVLHAFSTIDREGLP